MAQHFLQVSYDSVNKIWHSTHYPYKDQIQDSVGERFLKAMRTTDPNKIIDHFYDTNKQKTVREVYEESIIIATNLKRLGVEKGHVVVFFCTDNEYIGVLTMGCILIGAIVNFFEVCLEDEHVDYVFDVLKPNIILYEEKHKKKCFQSLKRKTLESCNHTISIDGQKEPNIKSELLKCNEFIDFDKFESIEIKDPEYDVAFLCLTSGTTGTPKVAQITHTLAIYNCYVWWSNKNNYEPLKEDSVIFSSSPLRWISKSILIFESMIMGIKRVGSCRDLKGRYGLELMREFKLTHIFSVPSVFYEILSLVDKNDMESLKSLKLIQLGGEQPTANLIELARKHCVYAKVLRCYGMTEMGGCIASDEDINGGKIMPGYRLQILNDKCEPLGPTQSGQIALKPPCILRDYKGIECKSYFNEKGFFINGDYGCMDDEGNLHVLARYKDLIRFNDLVLIPNSLEHIVMEISEISTARLVGYRLADEEENDIAAFFVVVKQGVSATEKEITVKIFNLLKTHLQSKELTVIQHIYYIDSLPVTTCGKVDRVALKKLAMKKSQSK